MLDRAVPVSQDIYKEKVVVPEGSQPEKLGTVLHVIRDSYKVIVPSEVGWERQVAMKGVFDRCKSESADTIEKIMNAFGSNGES